MEVYEPPNEHIKQGMVARMENLADAVIAAVEEVKAVDTLIVKIVLPQAYAVIDKLLDYTTAPKDVLLEARKLLPKQYKHTLIKPRA